MTSFRTGRGEQPPLFPSDGTRSPGRRRKAAAGRHRKEDLMERDRTRRPLFELDEVPQAAKIKVIGLGGGGSNAVSRMMAAEFTGVEFIVANTDVQALHASPAPVKLQLGAKLTQGLGAGSNPDIGRQAAQEDPDQITRLLHGADMASITAGLGGGTGTGAATVVASLAKDLGILPGAVVTKPVALDAAQKAVASPLLDDTSIQGARGILINFTGGADLSIHEVEEAARVVQEAAHEDANIIFGAVIDPHMTDEVRMTVIATGFAERKETVGGKVVDLPRAARASAAGAGSWRRRPGELRAEIDDALGDGDLEVPAFLRRQAD